MPYPNYGGTQTSQQDRNSRKRYSYQSRYGERPSYPSYGQQSSQSSGSENWYAQRARKRYAPKRPTYADRTSTNPELRSASRYRAQRQRYYGANPELQAVERDRWQHGDRRGLVPQRYGSNAERLVALERQRQQSQYYNQYSGAALPQVSTGTPHLRNPPREWTHYAAGAQSAPGNYMYYDNRQNAPFWDMKANAWSVWDPMWEGGVQDPLKAMEKPMEPQLEGELPWEEEGYYAPPYYGGGGYAPYPRFGGGGGGGGGFKSRDYLPTAYNPYQQGAYQEQAGRTYGEALNLTLWNI